jgi:hypothetical protein
MAESTYVPEPGVGHYPNASCGDCLVLRPAVLRTAIASLAGWNARCDHSSEAITSGGGTLFQKADELVA